jgi:hypothetical protein
MIEEGKRSRKKQQAQSIYHIENDSSSHRHTRHEKTMVLGVFMLDRQNVT